MGGSDDLANARKADDNVVAGLQARPNARPGVDVRAAARMGTLAKRVAGVDTGRPARSPITAQA